MDRNGSHKVHKPRVIPPAYHPYPGMFRVIYYNSTLMGPIKELNYVMYYIPAKPVDCNLSIDKYTEELITKLDLIHKEKLNENIESWKA